MEIWPGGTINKIITEFIIAFLTWTLNANIKEPNNTAREAKRGF